MSKEIESKREEKNNLQNDVNVLIEEKNRLEKIIESAEKALTNIIEYIKDKLPPKLFNFLNEFEFLSKANSKIADEIENKANEISDDETKNKIKEKKNSFKLK